MVVVFPFVYSSENSNASSVQVFASQSLCCLPAGVSYPSDWVVACCCSILSKVLQFHGNLNFLFVCDCAGFQIDYKSIAFRAWPVDVAWTNSLWLRLFRAHLSPQTRRFAFFFRWGLSLLSMSLPWKRQVSPGCEAFPQAPFSSYQSAGWTGSLSRGCAWEQRK